MSRAEFEAAAAEAVAVLGPAQTRDLAGQLAEGRSREYILHAVRMRTAGPTVHRLLNAVDLAGIPTGEVAMYLRGFAAAWTRQRELTEVQPVWSGPPTPGVPVRSTAQVLVSVVGQATTEVLAMTYSAAAYKPLTAALRAAAERGVEVDIVVETIQGAGGLLTGPEPARAFSELAGFTTVRLWHWPLDQREERGARQHAKILVVDRQVLFLGSANLTASGARHNIEAGVLIRGGTAPARSAEHVRELQRRGVLRPLK
ncbi:DISARM system phospholipase D-like protein DrmC [Saccharothrix sp. BKS2]|uniref:DISARM system phospholipase D-like protein DrmC n=1 Tax=Saccharothrix sp. BKS2 TaxID=3064400 RepID=UPI0039E902DE